MTKDISSVCSIFYGPNIIFANKNLLMYFIHCMIIYILGIQTVNPMSNDISYITNLCNNKFCMDIYSNVSLWKVVRPPKTAGNSPV